jgi:predicted  nucleic acid-binding Zn-ribbon protein
MTTRAEERLMALRSRDQRLCACGHKCISHGSINDDGSTTAVGMSGCGMCGCPAFAYPEGARVRMDTTQTWGGDVGGVLPIPVADRGVGTVVAWDADRDGPVSSAYVPVEWDERDRTCTRSSALVSS